MIMIIKTIAGQTIASAQMTAMVLTDEVCRLGCWWNGHEPFRSDDGVLCRRCHHTFRPSGNRPGWRRS